MEAVPMCYDENTVIDKISIMRQNLVYIGFRYGQEAGTLFIRNNPKLYYYTEYDS